MHFACLLAAVEFFCSVVPKRGCSVVPKRGWHGVTTTVAAAAAAVCSCVQVLEWLVGGTNTSSSSKGDDAAAALAAAAKVWDGVLVFDECHKAKNFAPGKEAQSTKVG
jgi:hypothetical protein